MSLTPERLTVVLACLTDALRLVYSFLPIQTVCPFNCHVFTVSRPRSLYSIPLVIPLPAAGHLIVGGVPVDTVPFVFPICFHVVLLCAELVQSGIRSSGGIAVRVGMDVMCPWKDVSSEFSCATILDPYSQQVLLFLSKCLFQVFPQELKFSFASTSWIVQHK